MKLREVSSWVWFWLPMSVVLATVVLGMVAKNIHPYGTTEWNATHNLYYRWFGGEAGIIEIATVIFLAAAAVLGISVVRMAFQAGWMLIGAWLLAVLAATIYFCGEEISWGQQIFQWQTPDWYQEATGNRQRETNLHNINSWFNQKPRMLFLSWVLVGGIVIPIWMRWKRRAFDPQTEFWYWFWPTWACTAIAIAAIAVWLPEELVKPFGGLQNNIEIFLWLPFNGDEIQEFCFGGFLFVYFASLFYRLRQYLALGLPQGQLALIRR